MKVKQIILRINYNSLKRITKVFPPHPKEIMSSYFNRLAQRLEMYQWKLTKQQEDLVLARNNE